MSSPVSVIIEELLPALAATAPFCEAAGRLGLPEPEATVIGFAWFDTPTGWI